ncbi:MAG: hypothetical protein MPJ04_02350 [Nitrosopumilus sp.]|nr:hypothetical protein [Nitrosopumilus sp.]MDA7954486.1 hypothetical protein [Nitrosopumilus sp.]MDA7973515.1 hypothetical protein [Nitrosopumilus sp.]
MRPCLALDNFTEPTFHFIAATGMALAGLGRNKEARKELDVAIRWAPNTEELEATRWKMDASKNIGA